MVRRDNLLCLGVLTALDDTASKRKVPGFLRGHQKEKLKFVPQRNNAYVEQNVNFSTFSDLVEAGESG